MQEEQSFSAKELVQMYACHIRQVAFKDEEMAVSKLQERIQTIFDSQVDTRIEFSLDDLSEFREFVNTMASENRITERARIMLLDIADKVQEEYTFLHKVNTGICKALENEVHNS